MSETFTNPPIIDPAYPPADGDAPIWHAASGTWRAGSAGGGGGVPVADSTTALTPVVGSQLLVRASFAYDFAASFRGVSGATVTSLPMAIGAGGTIQDTDGAQFSVGPIDTTADQYDLGGTLIISNTAGTQVARLINGGTFIASGNTAGSGTISAGWTTVAGATFSHLVGSDITFDGTNLIKTTAGGIFVVVFTTNGGWD